ncbi:hypothetical protein GCM10011514_06070 [Emticicia aquatilis]|uniref:HIRAN domain-containing protein n=1 Tax=Emticicia aquatilis TaxID=1537369 RepID=A0A916YHH7_9BACT|nr:HIRAN domain-containing protein [Emticicia aquatilis]GGD44841.1 hypothetical protein GCM10011514_06070 [Emticicia aquatilis]
MAQRRDYKGRFVKKNTNKRTPKTQNQLKWWQTALVFLSIIGVINGFIQMFNGKFYGLFVILFWVIIFFILARKWGKKNGEIKEEPQANQNTEAQIQREKVFADIRRRQFERLKPIIEANKPISLTQYEENNLRPFIDENFPNLEVKIVRPLIIETSIAGLQYHDANKKAVKDMLNDIPIGEPLELKRDFENTHSKTATRIYWESYWLGFVPSEYSKVVSEAIDSGLTVSASINDYDDTKTSFFKVQIEIRIDRV